MPTPKSSGSPEGVPFPGAWAAAAVLGILTGPALAAPDVTDLPPVYRGDLTIAYDGMVESDRLVESGESVGERTLAEHRMSYRLSASVVTGAGLVLELPHYLASSVSFAEGRQMEFDPLDDDGTLVGTAPLGRQPSAKGAGLGGTWIGVRGAPFHQEAFDIRRDRFSWVLEAGYRFQDKSNFWSTGEGNARGAGPGASALRLKSAWSTTHRMTSPYLQTTLVRTGRVTTTVTDATGSTSAQAVVVRPASTLALDAGAEVLLSEYGEEGGRVVLDLRSQLRYDSWQDVPSGLYLPSVLDASRASIVTQDETLSLRGGMGVNWRMVEYLQLNLGGGAGFTSPHQPEHLYEVTTGLGAWHWYVSTSLRFRARDPLMQDLFGG